MNKRRWILGTAFLLFSIQSAFAFVRGADRFELSAGGDIPFYTGIQGRYNWSTQYYTKVGAGFAMELFMDTHQRMWNEIGISRHTRLLTSALVNSVVFDLRFGWSMSVYEGPYVELGYNFMLWGKGEVQGGELNSAISPKNTLSHSTLYQVNIQNHGPTVHIGYRFILIDKLTLNMDLGVYKPLFSRTELNYGDDISVSAGESEKVNELVVRKLWFLSLGLWLGVSF